MDDEWANADADRIEARLREIGTSERAIQEKRRLRSICRPPTPSGSCWPYREKRAAG
jgi:hypothetical protein